MAWGRLEVRLSHSHQKASWVISNISMLRSFLAVLPEIRKENYASSGSTSYKIVVHELLVRLVSERRYIGPKHQGKREKPVRIRRATSRPPPPTPGLGQTKTLRTAIISRMRLVVVSSCE